MELYGLYECKVDDKGRMLLPAFFRKQMKANGQQGVILTRENKGLWFLFPIKNWENMEKEEKERFKLLIKIKIDSLGRILFPRSFKKFFTDFKKRSQVILLGREDRIIVFFSESEMRKYLNQ